MSARRPLFPLLGTLALLAALGAPAFASATVPIPYLPPPDVRGQRALARPTPTPRPATPASVEAVGSNDWSPLEARDAQGAGPILPAITPPSQRPLAPVNPSIAPAPAAPSPSAAPSPIAAPLTPPAPPSAPPLNAPALPPPSLAP